jgi:hypothetical protein
MLANLGKILIATVIGTLFLGGLGTIVGLIVGIVIAVKS